MTEPASAIAGIRLAAVAAGIRYQGRDDLVLIELATGTQIAAVFTSNAFCAAPVTLARRHLQSAPSRYLLINSGNANAGTGAPGMQAAQDSCQAVAELTGVGAESVLPFSTGVIGEALDVAPIRAALPGLLTGLEAGNWPVAAKAIMTTDTVPKRAQRSLRIGATTVNIHGIAKGSGMIRPDMATMLAYIGTDASIAAEPLQAMLTAAMANSFNAITVDGDTSTNDACVLMATGRADMAEIQSTDDAAYGPMQAAVDSICIELAQAIIRDAEGATRFISIEVQSARDAQEARQVAFTVAHSPLVKTALSAGDPNWGRILAAVGRAGLERMAVDQVQIWLGKAQIVENGGLAPGYTEAAGQAALQGTDQLIRIALGRGTADARVWTSDLTCEYVRINADYRS